MLFKLLVSLYEVPNGAIVTKRTGEKNYTVQRSLRIFTEGESGLKEVKCDSGFVFLVQNNGDVNAVIESKEVCWHASEQDVRNLLDPNQLPTLR